MRQLPPTSTACSPTAKSPPRTQPPLLARVQDAITQLEAEHPDVTAMLDGVSRKLDMGI